METTTTNNKGQKMTDMFIKITKSDAAAMQQMSKAAILILIEMRFFAGIDGQAYPSKGTLAENTGLSLGSIKRGLKELREKGAINLKSTKRTSSNIYDVGGIISKPKGIISKPVEDQKRSDGGSFLSRRGIENDPLSRNSKEIKEIDPIKESTDNTKKSKPYISDDVDVRDLWLGELWAKHATVQGWVSIDVQKDFDAIKAGASIVQVAKAVCKLDHFIAERNIQGMYVGRGWASKIKERWVSKEADQDPTKYDHNKMRLSTLSIDPEIIEEIKTQALQAVDSADKAQAAAMNGNGKAQSLWAGFRANAEDYEQCANVVFDWVRDGGLTDDLRNEIQADPNLVDFAALIDCAVI